MFIGDKLWSETNFLSLLFFKGKQPLGLRHLYSKFNLKVYNNFKNLTKL